MTRKAVRTDRSTSRLPLARRLARSAATLVAVIVVTATLAGLVSCNPESGAFDLSRRAKNQWDKGEYEDAARSFVALSEIYPASTLVEESLYFAASLYDEYLGNKPSAIRYYQLLLVKFPDGQYASDARQSLAELYESDPDTLYRALQIYRQLVLAKELRDRQEE
ncbi:MAG TPA: hypothetical protein VF678_05430, partial [bacterium]